jgi:signal transduction histidine kinase
MKMMSINAYSSEYSPEEAALLLRLNVFVVMRWLAVAGVLLAAVVAFYVFKVDFPIIWVYGICAFIMGYNTVLFFQTRGLQKEKTGNVIHRAKSYGYIHLWFDLVTLTVLLHFTGGIENPFIIYYVFHVITASIVLSKRTTYYVAASALAMVIALVSLEYLGILPHHNLQGFSDPTLYKQPIFVLPVLVALATVIYGSIYMTTAISGESKIRQRQVNQLNKQIIESTTAELAREKEMQDKLSKAYQDLSESHRQLKESQEQLIQVEKLRSLGQLAASIAHEINNPLSGVLLYTQLLTKKINAEDFSKKTAIEYLTKMESELTRSTKLVKNLLDFARQSQPAFKLVDINDIINWSLELTSHTAGLEHVTIQKVLDLTIPQFIGDFDQLQQVFTNMILNAIHAMPDGGTLMFKTSVINNIIKVEVQDTGKGISQENIHKLFTPFFTTKKEVKGVGLGLAISYGIIQRHGGKIEVKSKEGEGTTFIICLPVDAKKQQEITSSPLETTK